MKRVRIKVGSVAIVKRNGNYNRTITAGVHWLGIFETIETYDMTLLYKPDSKFEIKYKDPNFKEMVEVVDVQDNEIGLKFIGKNFDSVLLPGKYFYWKGIAVLKFDIIDLSTVEITQKLTPMLLEKEAIKRYVREFNVESYEEGLLFTDGKFVRKLKQGKYLFWKNPTQVEVKKVDLRQVQVEISGQELLTRDKVALRVNFQAQYKVTNAEKAIQNSKDFEKQLYILMQLALREFVGSKSLDEVLDNKEIISEFVLDKVKNKAEKLGILVLDAGIRDVILPGEVKEIMNKVLIAQKMAQANIITRREETASTRSLLNTAKLMEDNSMLFKLKEMEYVERIADKIGEITVSGNGKVIDQLQQIFTK